MKLVEWYVCLDCGSQWEELSETSDVRCLQCGSKNFTVFDDKNRWDRCDTCDKKDECIIFEKHKKTLA